MPEALRAHATLPNLPALEVRGTWETVLQGAARDALEAALPAFVVPRRWFGSKARAMETIRFVETIPILQTAYLTLIRIAYADGGAETYVLPLGFATGPQAQALRQDRPAAAIATLRTGQANGLLYDALWDPDFCEALLGTIWRRQRYQGSAGELVAWRSGALPGLRGDPADPLPPVPVGVEQSNSSVRYGERLILKLYRRLAVGINPDQEIGQFLTEKTAFANTPPLAGVLEYRVRQPGEALPITVALLQGFVRNQGDAWRYTLDALADYFRQAGQRGETGIDELSLPGAGLLELARRAIPPQAEQLIGGYMASARLLGRRTAELHLALASDPADPVFAPEPFTAEFQAYLQRSMRELTERVMGSLAARLEALPAAGQAAARQVLDLEQQIVGRFGSLLAHPIHAVRARIHGDYHLGQVLYTGDDFVIIDFEGEPARPLGERQMKRSPLQDVAGMLRSFHYAAYAAYFALDENGAPAPELEAWARFWHLWVSVAYLQTYLEVVDAAPFLPDTPEDLDLLLSSFLVEKAVYELGYELNNRPGWVRIPLQGILQVIRAR